VRGQNVTDLSIGRARQTPRLVGASGIDTPTITEFRKTTRREVMPSAFCVWIWCGHPGGARDRDRLTRSSTRSSPAQCVYETMLPSPKQGPAVPRGLHMIGSWSSSAAMFSVPQEYIPSVSMIHDDGSSVGPTRTRFAPAPLAALRSKGGRTCLVLISHNLGPPVSLQASNRKITLVYPPYALSERTAPVPSMRAEFHRGRVLASAQPRDRRRLFLHT